MFPYLSPDFIIMVLYLQFIVMFSIFNAVVKIFTCTFPQNFDVIFCL